MAHPDLATLINGFEYAGVAFYVEFREAVFQQAAATQLRTLARGLPEFSSMQEDGLLKAMSGLTSLAEIIANAPRDTDPRPMSVLRGISKSWAMLNFGIINWEYNIIIILYYSIKALRFPARLSGFPDL